MKLRRIVATLVVLAMMVLCLPIQAFAATSGVCGKNVKWKLDSNGVLTISGKGPMDDFEYAYGTPSYDPSTGVWHPVVPPWRPTFQDGDKVQEIYIQEGITSIGDYAFQWLGQVKKVTIPSTVTRIGMRAFEGCSKLTQIKLPNGLKEIGGTAFSNTGVTEMVFPAEITTVPASVLYECTGLQSVQFLGPIVDIGSGAFSGCTSLTSVSFSQGWTGQIGSSAFKSCKNLVNFDLPSGVTSIGKDAFRDCTNLNAVVFPNTLVSIGEEAYASCQSISSVTIPESVISLARGAFMDCTNLKTVTMHASTVDGIGKKTFNIFHNTPLEYAHIQGNEPEEKTNLFGTRDYNFVVYYDKDADGWDGVTWSGHVIKAWGDDSYDFGGTIGDNITWTLKGDVLTISGTGTVTGLHAGQAPWYDVKELVKKLVIEEGITDYGSAAFSLNRMTEIEIADTVTILHNFEKCHSLEVVTVPASVKETGAFLFRDSGVKTVYFEGDAPKFHAAAFVGPGFGGSDDLTVMYPAGNDTWTEEVRQDYGGNVTWIPYCNHNYETVTVEADCITPGTTSHVCSKCGDTQVEPGWIPPQGHDYGLAEDGNPDFWDTTCDVCGAERVVDKHRPTHSMYRMYNPNSGEHFYTGSMEERKNLEAAGWKYEGVGFTFPATTGKPVYRLYDKFGTMEHLYTMDEAEKDKLLAEGWVLEGIAFNSGREDEVPQYRLHNPNATIGAYHFTASTEEKDALIAAGWEYQGIGFYTCLQ